MLEMFGFAWTVDMDVVKVATTNFLKKGLSIWFINLIKVLDALDNPKGMTVHSYSPSESWTSLATHLPA